MERYDLAVIGAGAAGMMCAAVAGQRGRSVVLIDHSERPGEKIRISGGGRCNFTNLQVGPENFLSRNPHFCRSALARYTPRDFLALLGRHRIGYHEKHKGQLFCDDSSASIVAMLRAECETGRVSWRLGCAVAHLAREEGGFRLDTEAGGIAAARVVVATGGLSIPQIGATDFGLRVARQFGLKIVEPRPALVPLKFAPEVWRPFADLAGIGLEVRIACNDGRYDEDLLFTHRGLSGPAILQASSHWNLGDRLVIDLAPGTDLPGALAVAKDGSRQTLLNVLASLLPRRLVEVWLVGSGRDGHRCIAEWSGRGLAELAASLHRWEVLPSGTEGWRKAEVMRGGVDTDELSQVNLEARRVPGLHFIGEVVDVTGWLGGYNFQWAWASAQAAGRAV